MKYVSCATPSVVHSWTEEYPYNRKTRRWVYSQAIRIFPDKIDWEVLFDIFTME